MGVRREKVFIDLLWRPFIQIGVRPVLVVPGDIEGELPAHGISTKRHLRLPRTFVLHCTDETLDDGYGKHRQLHPIATVKSKPFASRIPFTPYSAVVLRNEMFSRPNDVT